jgi:D-beta-D-heptose 7-phosphate kinase/D-beta-D-heptose 1-phosphate adenosyltransferase
MKKIKTFSSIKTIIKNYKKTGKNIIFTNGCFDILHAGHVQYLSEAKRLGDILIIGLNSDNSIAKIKGEKRPIISQKYRALLLETLEMVNYVVIFEETTPLKLLHIIRPDWLVKGGNLTKKEIVGADFVESYGGKVKNLSCIKGLSTSKIIDKIKATYK